MARLLTFAAEFWTSLRCPWLGELNPHVFLPEFLSIALQACLSFFHGIEFHKGKGSSVICLDEDVDDVSVLLKDPPQVVFGDAVRNACDEEFGLLFGFLLRGLVGLRGGRSAGGVVGGDGVPAGRAVAGATTGAPWHNTNN